MKKQRIIVPTAKSILILFGSLFVAGCSLFEDDKKDESSGGSGSPSETVATTPPAPPAGGAPSAPPAARSPSTPPASAPPTFALSQRLTPEQISNQLNSATGYRFGFELEEHNLFFDLILTLFNTPLGGVDFTTSSFRDPLTKVQTVLTVRTIAWTFAKMVMYNETSKATADRLLFTHTEPLEEIPLEGYGIEKWNAQIDDIYWRFFSRPITDAERTAISNSFMAIRDSYSQLPGWQQNFMAWAGILYSLFSTTEFWSI